jgi:hypothetical protein
MKLIRYLIMCITVAGGLILQGCEKSTEPTREPRLDSYPPPTIEVTAPEIPDEGLTASVGGILNFTLSINAPAGIDQILLNGEEIMKYGNGQLIIDYSYPYIVPEIESIEMAFSVIDEDGQSDAADAVMVYPEIGFPKDYLVMDFGGSLTNSWNEMISGWDDRVFYEFSIVGDHVTSSVVSIVGNQGTMTFDGANPDGDGTVMKLYKNPNEWGGYTYMIYDFGLPFPQEVIDEVEDSLRVMQLEVFYDETEDPDYSLADAIISETWGVPPGNGMNFTLLLCNYDLHFDAHDEAGIFMAKEAYLNEANQWVTLSFVLPSGQRASSGDVTSDLVDCVDIRPSPGYNDSGFPVNKPLDNNPYYFRNLRFMEISQ